MKKKILTIIGILLLIMFISLIAVLIWYLDATGKDDFELYREFYSPNRDYIVVDYTDAWGGMRPNIDGFLHVYKTNDEISDQYSINEKNALWHIKEYCDFSYGGPYLISWIDNIHIRINNECFNVIEGTYIEDYTPTYPFYSIVEFYSPDGKYVIVNCTIEEEDSMSGIIILYETDNYETFICEPEKVFTDSNYLKIIEDKDGNFGTVSGGNPYRIKWIDDENFRIENAIYNIDEGKVIEYLD